MTQTDESNIDVAGLSTVSVSDKSNTWSTVGKLRMGLKGITEPVTSVETHLEPETEPAEKSTMKN